MFGTEILNNGWRANQIFRTPPADHFFGCRKYCSLLKQVSVFHVPLEGCSYSGVMCCESMQQHFQRLARGAMFGHRIFEKKLSEQF